MRIDYDCMFEEKNACCAGFAAFIFFFDKFHLFLLLLFSSFFILSLIGHLGQCGGVPIKLLAPLWFPFLFTHSLLYS